MITIKTKMNLILFFEAICFTYYKSIIAAEFPQSSQSPYSPEIIHLLAK